MSKDIISKLKTIRNFESLVEYLRDELDWPIEVEDTEDITFDYNPNELGIEEKYTTKINIIKQIRPLTDDQPWGIFYIEFESKKLPVIVLRRILRALIYSRRKANDRIKSWDLADLIFISSLGEINERKISFAHFSESEYGLPELRTFSWDDKETYFHYRQNQLDLGRLRWPENVNETEKWREEWSEAFVLKHREVIRTSQQLAIRMAHIAAEIRESVKNIFKYEVRDGPLHNLFNNFKKALFRDLKLENFADMYAQTITYGLFSARASQENEFALDNISTIISNTNPFLKKLFEECTRIGELNLKKLDLEELGVAELIRLLKGSNIEAVLQDFGKQKKGEDPVIHFYELFLKEYDYQQKIQKGVFYTPDPVVSFIVRSVNNLIIKKLNCPDGFADVSKIPINYMNQDKYKKEIKNIKKQIYKVQILDPATGTGTFLKYVIEEIKKTFDVKYKNLDKVELKKKWNEYFSKQILPRLFGFELMLAPYAVAHLKLGLKLKETGYDFKTEKRLGVFLTNSLESPHEGAENLDSYLNWLSKEVQSANKVKKKSISVIIGNPPYNTIASSGWIKTLMNDYGTGLGVENEKKKGVIQDEYVKFIRFAQWKVEQLGVGIIGYITNNSYLDGLVHRRMRQCLMECFDEIFILNLHGNRRRNDPDENVFDIQQGVAIGFFIKYNKGKHQANECKVYYYSTLIDENIQNREDKYKFLITNDIITLSWKRLPIISIEEEFQKTRWNQNLKDKFNTTQFGFYFFVPKSFNEIIEYGDFFGLMDIFKMNGSGISSGKDAVLIKFFKDELKPIIQEILNDQVSIERIQNKYELFDTSAWKPSIRIQDARKIPYDENKFQKILYRPFDERWIYYDKKLLQRHLYNTIKHLLFSDNLALITVREITSQVFNHVLVTDKIIDRDPLSAYVSERSYIFPLFLYEENTKTKGIEQILNIKKKYILILRQKYYKEEGTITDSQIALDLFHYIYAVLNDPKYKERYAEFLKIDFPRIPLYDLKTFKKYKEFGKKLTELHLLKKKIDVTPEVSGENFYVKGKRVKFDKSKKGIWINEETCLCNISKEIWEYKIGAYQFIKKYIKSRNRRVLNKDTIEYIYWVVAIIKETNLILKKIKELIPQFENSL